MTLRQANISLVWMLLATVPTAESLAAEGSAEPPFRFYSAVDGLTQSDVNDIEQDRAGYLWFTTMRGLNRYDGMNFDHFTISDGLPTNSLTELYIDPDNTVWVGDVRGGISVIRATRVAKIIEPMSNTRTPIRGIDAVGDRMLVLAEGLGILEIVAEGEDYRLEPLGGQSIGAKHMSVSGNDIWIAATSGLYRASLKPELDIQLVAESIIHIHTAADGTLWVADLDNHIGIWKNGVLDIRAIVDTANELIGVMTDTAGTVWVTTRTELFSFDGGRPDIIQTGESIRKYEGSDEITSLFVDRENTLWLASESRLIRFLGERFRHFRLKSESDSESVWAIGEDGKGRLWFGTQSKLLMRQDDESLIVIGPDHGIPRGAVRDLVFSAAGDLWAGVRGKGLFQVNTGTLQGKLIGGTEGLEILDVAIANDGAVWFSTFSTGVLRYSPSDEVLKTFRSPEDTSVFTLDIWEDDSVWYGADEIGLVHLIPQGNGQYAQEIFDSKLILKNATFNQLQLTGENELWVATEEGGLHRFETGHFLNLGSERPWADQTVYLVEVLENGDLVVGGEQGVYQFLPGSKRIAHYNQNAGFMGMETNIHATFIDSQKYLWIGTPDGATRMDTMLPMPEFVEPSPRILNMETELDRIPVVHDSDVDPRQRGVHVEFAAVSLLNPRGIQYSYKLVGMDDEWRTAKSNRSVSYSRMPPGSYEFTVRARYPGGEWSRETAKRHFTVLPFFWQKPWFVLSMILLVLAALRAAMDYRTRKIENLNEMLRAQIAERTRTIEKARQHLQESNEKLSCEILERQEADKARIEIETRFRRAFENARIGMGLLDAAGRLFDANPALKKMFWPKSEPPSKVHFTDILHNSERDEFMTRYEKLAAGELDSIEEKHNCRRPDDETLLTVVSLSAVRSDSNALLYSVLQVQDVTESRRLTAQLEYQASFDDLTGLLNRRSFELELNRAWELGNNKDELNYLIYMDLDQFKVVNDTSGHAAGDQLLQRVSALILSVVRANDTVCRLGGDEFGIILWKCPPAVAKRIAEAIRASIDNLRFQWDTENYRVGVSIGGLPIDPEVGDTGELQQLADAACYAAKEAGRNRVHMVDGEKDSARVHRGQVRWVQRLREAMDNNRFVIYGQIIKPLAADADEPERLEVLLRLRDPATRKLIPPGAFLPAAERYGLSIELDQWVVQSLLDTLFVHQSFATEYRKYWVNLSGTSIGDKRFARFLVDALKQSPLPPGTINFEITETAVIRSVVEAGNLMAELREMGCQFALDDFGSGLSSFGYLKKLPVDYLKIDGMFIRDILNDKTDRIFVKSIIDIAHTLNIKTVAEFVENDEMLDVMRELGADYVQGFGVGRPFALAPQFPRSTDFDVTIVEAQKKAS